MIAEWNELLIALIADALTVSVALFHTLYVEIDNSYTMISTNLQKGHFRPKFDPPDFGFLVSSLSFQNNWKKN